MPTTTGTRQCIRGGGAGDDWGAIVQHLGSGFISLRAKATTVAGDTVQQTIIRAYSLR